MLHINQTQNKSPVMVSQEIKILLILDPHFAQHKLEKILSAQDNLSIIGITSKYKEATLLVRSLEPDLVLIDITPFQFNCIEIALAIKQQSLDCKIIVLSNNKDKEYVQKIISVGVDGYLLEENYLEDLVTAIYSIVKEYFYFSAQLFKQIKLADNTANNTSIKPSTQTEIKPKITSEILSPTKSKYPSRSKWLMWSGLGIAIAVGGWWVNSNYLQQSTEPVQVEMYPVEKGTVENTFSESGRLELGEQQTVKSPEDNATIEKVEVSMGDKIKAGETLLVLRDRETQEQVQEQKIENSKNLFAQLRNQEKVAKAQKTIRKEQALVKDSVALYKKGYIAESELEEDREQLETAVSELKDAEIEYNSAKLEIQNGQAKLASFEQKLSDRLITSPINGIVLDVRVKNEDGITTEDDLLTIGDPNQEIVKLQFNTLDAAKVKINQPARISVIGPNPQVYPGRVISLSPQATTESEDSTNTSESSDGSPKVNATVRLNKPSRTMIPGSQVNVEIISQQRQNVITLPLEMLQGSQSEPFVWVKRDGKAKKQPVSLGLEDLTSVEITSGLQSGEQVILPTPESTIAPGTPLQTSPEESL